jgi:hypothetical protein
LASFPCGTRDWRCFFVLAAVFGLKEFPNELSSSPDSRFQALLWFRGCPQPLIIAFVTVRMLTTTAPALFGPSEGG